MSKRLFDVLIASLGLVILLPFFLILAGLIVAGSPGPVFYRGWRTGRFGVAFRIFKFRTMIVDAEAQGTTSVVDDPRITSVGHWLRRWKLDELPQLINVVVGDMSLVGPRPEVEEHTSAYSEEEKEILSVRPGITDLASMRFVRLAEELGTENPHQVYVTRLRAEKNALRLQYVRGRTFWGDVRIILQTLWTVVAPRRASGQS